MKYTFFFLAFLASTTSFAQKRSTAHTAYKNDGRCFVQQLLNTQYQRDLPRAKTTAITQRLIGFAEHAPNMTILDSFSAKYSGERGSKFNLEFMGYWQWIGPGFILFNDIFGYSNVHGNYASSNMGTFVLADTVKTFAISPAPPYSYGPFGTQTHAFDAIGNITEESYFGAGYVLSQRDILTYNGASLPTIIVEFEYDLLGTGAFDSAYGAFLTYNGANQLVVDSECTYDYSTHTMQPMTKYMYTYDGSGNMIHAEGWAWAPGWTLERSYNMTYYPGTHQLKTYGQDSYMPGAVPQYRDSFGYTPGISYSTYNQHEEYSGGSVSDKVITMRHVNAGGLPDTIDLYDYSGTAVAARTRNVFFYNSYNNPDSLITYRDASAATPTTLYGKTFYYYELYNATSVPGTMVAASPIKVYPNPVSDILHLTSDELSGKEKLTVMVSNSNGRKVKSVELLPGTQSREISLGDMFPGQYWITVFDSAGGLLDTKQVLKL